MHVHELRKTLAWYSRGLRSGSELRQRAGAVKDPRALLDLGEAFFEHVTALEASGVMVAVLPADPVAKSIARQDRREGIKAEAEECAA
jgi:hypothetical protein